MILIISPFSSTQLPKNVIYVVLREGKKSHVNVYLYV